MTIGEFFENYTASSRINVSMFDVETDEETIIDAEQLIDNIDDYEEIEITDWTIEGNTICLSVIKKSNRTI